ncbi:MAG: hypothetical protein NT149_03815 [Candidatus Gottesmanbacteria bacterium]|nr:hypothetical protein [Candidatus Gottesmanbacteria bacterium]
MLKIETIWHHILYLALEKGQFQSTQKALAYELGYSLSTVHSAIRQIADIGAADVSSRFFVLRDVKKLLYFWATHRNFKKDIIYQTYVDEPILEIEGRCPDGAIFACYTAARMILKEPPADYSKVYFYFDKTKIDTLTKRFPEVKSDSPNLFVLDVFPKQPEYGVTTTLAQTFVDVWNLHDWYAKDFLIELERKIDELLS